MRPLSMKQPSKGFDYKISYMIHKHLTYTAVDSKRNTFTILLTRIWQFLSFLNNGVLQFSTLFILLILGIVNDIWPIPILSFIIDWVFLTRTTVIIVLVFYFIDLFILGTIKYFVKRKRPPYFEESVLARGGLIKMLVNKWMDNVGVDKYTFPSGHCSRIVLLTVMTFFLSERNLYVTIPLGLLLLPMGLARIALAKHFVFDVICGYIVGVFEGLGFYFWWWLILERWVMPVAPEAVVSAEG